MSDVESRSTRRGVWISVISAVVVLVGVVALVVVRNDSGSGADVSADETPPVLVLPEEAAGHTRLETAAAVEFAESAESDLRSQAPGADVVVGTFTEGEAQLVLAAFVFGADTDQGRALEASPEDALQDYLESAGVEDVSTYDAGARGGAVLCGTVGAGDGSQVSCGWADRWTLGSLRFATGPLADGPGGEAAAVTVEFRDATVPAP